MGADGGHNDILCRGFHNGAACGQGSRRWNRWGWPKSPLSPKMLEMRILSPHTCRSMTRATAPLVMTASLRATGAENHPPVTNHPNVQKHPVFQGVFPADQPGELGEFVLLQLSHEPHAAHVDPHNGTPKLLASLAAWRMVPSPPKQTKKSASGSSVFISLILMVGSISPMLFLSTGKGKQHSVWTPAARSRGFAAFGGLQTPCPERIGAQDNFHGSFPSNLAWDASTRAARSPV